jgi:hypothetical protein
MLFRIAIVALSALCCFVSGCGGCSKEPKPVVDDGVPPRMKDPAYTNQLVQLQGRQKKIAAQMAALQSKIERLGAEAKTKPEYADLTNRLAQCEAELERVRKETLLTVRTRLLKDSAKKDNLKK